MAVSHHRALASSDFPPIGESRQAIAWPAPLIGYCTTQSRGVTGRNRFVTRKLSRRRFRRGARDSAIADASDSRRVSFTVSFERFIIL